MYYTLHKVNLRAYCTSECILLSLCSMSYLLYMQHTRLIADKLLIKLR